MVSRTIEALSSWEVIAPGSGSICFGDPVTIIIILVMLMIIVVMIIMVMMVMMVQRYLCKFIELIILLSSARSRRISTFLFSDGENPIIQLYIRLS